MTAPENPAVDLGSAAPPPAAAPGTELTPKKAVGKKGVNLQQYGILLALGIIVVLFEILTQGRLLMADNVASLLQQNAYVIILALGMLMIIIAGHIDLSVGSVVAFLGGVMAIAMMHWGLPWPVAVLVGIAAGLLVGAWQGFWVAYVGIPGFIVTLAGMLLFRGLAIVIVGETIAGFPNGFVQVANGGILGWFGFAGQADIFTLVLTVAALAAFVFSQLRARQRLISHNLTTESMGLFVGKLVIISALVVAFGYILSLSSIGTPFVLIICAVLVLAYSFVMSNTVFGRNIYAIGGNIAAARLSGIDVRKSHFLMYVNMGFLTAIAAIVATSRSGAAVAAAGNNYELDAIAACFIGGAAVSGGVGRVSGVIIGALIMGVLNMGLSIMAVDSAWQQAIKGLVLLAAVAFDMIQKRKGAGV